MKLNNLLLPHPVLGQADDINSSFGFKESPTIDIKQSTYQIEFEIEHDNGTIADLVRVNKAIYCCEVNCAGTLFREIFTSKDPRFGFEIPRTSLRKRVDFQVFCLALEDIPNYYNPTAHPDFSGFIFELEKADLLGVFGAFRFNADVQYHKLKAASSFLQIIPNEGDEEFTKFVLDDSKIQVKLPKALYEKYKQDYIGKKREFADIIHASLVQNALTIALFNFKEHLERENVWAVSIQHRLLSEPELNNCSDHVDPNNIPDLVQKLLGNPNKRMIEQLEKLSIVNQTD
ncbi:hypothetical protein [Mariniradius sediminis]|uniref:TIGR04255 family protein n=1 Tax=Mariniradius sediminis TaxID=2909237 RepID=A0ABS9BNG4_9BACT|nr:hypothetical protein [Mariniradius sediminis]MCF1749598.1 hypothetical protein [Mariniradius sediminis]